MACTVLPLLLTAHLLPRRFSLPRWQQYHPTYGQQPPGHSVPSHCLLAAILAN